MPSSIVQITRTELPQSTPENRRFTTLVNAFKYNLSDKEKELDVSEEAILATITGGLCIIISGLENKENSPYKKGDVLRAVTNGIYDIYETQPAVQYTENPKNTEVTPQDKIEIDLISDFLELKDIQSVDRFKTNWHYLMILVEKISQEMFADGEVYHLRTFGMYNAEVKKFMVRFNRHRLFQDEDLKKATFDACIDALTNLKEYAN